MNIEIINYVYCTEYYIGNYNSMYNVHISIYLDFFCKIKEDLRKSLIIQNLFVQILTHIVYINTDKKNILFKNLQYKHGSLLKKKMFIFELLDTFGIVYIYLSLSI